MPANSIAVSVCSALTSDGYQLRLRRYRAANATSVLLCTHAMMANSRYLRRFAIALAESGLDVFTLDWRGHGMSVPPSPHRDRYCFDDYVERDLPAAWQSVCDTAGIAMQDLFYLGHSLGGQVGAAGIATGVVPNPRALFLVATSVWLPGPEGSRLRRGLMALYHASTRPLGYAPIRRLGLGTDDEPADYIRQVNTWARTGEWTSKAGADYWAALCKVGCPTYSHRGVRDRLCSESDSPRLLAAISGQIHHREWGKRHGDTTDADHFGLLTGPLARRLASDIASRISAITQGTTNPD